MNHHVRHLAGKIFVGVTLALALSACVSVNIGNKKVSRSEDVKFQVPAKPFEEIKLQSADHAWQNKSSGSTLSYLSICNDNADPELTNLRDSTLNGVEKMKIEKEDSLNYNGREALKTFASGSLDGVKVEIHLMNFKKNNCSYTISLVGIAGKIKKDPEVFENFLKGFVAP